VSCRVALTCVLPSVVAVHLKYENSSQGQRSKVKVKGQQNLITSGVEHNTCSYLVTSISDE